MSKYNTTSLTFFLLLFSILTSCQADNPSQTVITPPTTPIIPVPSDDDDENTLSDDGAAQNDSEPNTTPSNEETYPLTMAFRSSQNNTDLDLLTNYDFIHDLDIRYLNDAEDLFGDSAITLHHNSSGLVSISNYTSVYPGHWLYGMGSLARRSFNSTKNEIYVNDASRFRIDDYLTIAYFDSARGEILWNMVELVKITAEPDTVNNILTVSRGEEGTTALSWSVGTYDVAVKPMTSLDSLTPDAKAINITRFSPLDVNGASGLDYFADYIHDNFWVDRFAQGIDGFEFDMAKSRLENDNGIGIDCNNDFVADYCFVDGVNEYLLATNEMVEALRARMPGVILQFDSSLPEKGFRSLLVNGIEMENFPLMENQDFRKFSSAFHHLRYFVENVEPAYKTSYGLTKADTRAYKCDAANSTANSNAIQRLGMAANSLLLMPHAYAAETESTGQKCFDVYVFDEYTGGSLNNPKWLGQVRSGLVRNTDDLGTDNLLTGVTWSDRAATTTYSISSTTSQDGSSFTLSVDDVPSIIEIRPDGSYFPNVAGASMIGTISRTNSTTTSKAFTLSFTASAINTNHETSYEIPRLMLVKLVTTSGDVYPQNILVDSAARDFSLTFKLGTRDSISRIIIGSGEETGILSVSNMQLVTGFGDRFIRYFENGAVILNSSSESWTVSLDTTYSANGYQRLDGSIDPIVNNGTNGVGTERNQFTVPANDALFVTKR